MYFLTFLLRKYRILNGRGKKVLNFQIKPKFSFSDRTFAIAFEPEYTVLFLDSIIIK